MTCHFCPLPLSHPLPLLSSLLVFVLFLEYTEHIPTRGPFCGLLPLPGTFFPCLSTGLAPLPSPILRSEVTFALKSILIILLKIVTYHPYHFWLPLLFLFFCSTYKFPYSISLICLVFGCFAQLVGSYSPTRDGTHDPYSGSIES